MRITYYVGDILTGLIQGDLPFYEVTCESLLSSVGTFKGKLNLLDPDVIARGGSHLTLEGKSTLWVDVDGAIIWCGIIWATQYDGDAGVLEVAGSDFWSYLQRRIVTDDISMPGATVQAVIDKLMSYALTDNAPYGLGVAYVGGAETTQTLDFSYQASDRKTVAELLEAEAAASPGWDFRTEGFWAQPNQPQVTYVFGAPRLGQPFATTRVAFDMPGGVVKYTETRDGTSFAGRLFVRGNSDGSDVQEYTFEDTSLYQRYPRYDAAQSVDQSDSAAVQSRGRYLHYARKRVLKKPSIVVRPEQPHISTYKVGDDALLNIDDARHPGGEQFDYRLATISFNIDSSEVTLTHWEDPSNG